MSGDEEPAITPLLEKAAAGDARAFDAVARLVQADLKRLARRILSRRADGVVRTVTLDPGALVNETFVRLLHQRRLPRNRAHFFAIATRIMFRVLRDHNRAKRAEKRHAEIVYLSFPALDARARAAPPSTEASRVVAELDALESADARAGKVAKLRLIWDLPLDEIAAILGVSRSTVDREWRIARAWLRERL